MSAIAELQNPRQERVRSQATLDSISDDQVRRVELIASRPLSLMGAVVSCSLDIERLTTRKIELLSNQIQELEETLNQLLLLKKNLIEEGPKEMAQSSIDSLKRKGIDLPLLSTEREKLLEGIQAHSQMLHTKIQRLVTVDLARTQNNLTTMMNIGQDILRLGSRHIQNILERMRH